VETQTLIRLIIGLSMTAIVVALAAKRVLWLTKLISSGQPTADERGRKNHLGERLANQAKEVFGQTRLLLWSVPGIAHLFTMWGFFVLATVYLEAYGVLFDPKFHIPVVGKWAVLGFLRTSSPLRCCSASSPSRSSGCGPNPRNTAGRHGSTAPTPEGPG
jgi:hypothetical protein